METGDIFNDLFGSQIALEHELCTTSLEYPDHNRNVHSKEPLIRSYSVDNLHGIDLMQQTLYYDSNPLKSNAVDFELLQQIPFYQSKRDDEEMLPYGIADPDIFLKRTAVASSDYNNSSTPACSTAASENCENGYTETVSLGQIVDGLDYSTVNDTGNTHSDTVAPSQPDPSQYLTSICEHTQNQDKSLEHYLNYECHSNELLVLLSTDTFSLIQSLSPELSGIDIQQSAIVNSSVLESAFGNEIATCQRELTPSATTEHDTTSTVVDISSLLSTAKPDSVLSDNNQLTNNSSSVSLSTSNPQMQDSSSITGNTCTSNSDSAAVGGYTSDSDSGLEMDETRKVKKLLRMHFMSQKTGVHDEIIKEKIHLKRKHSGGWTKGKKRKTDAELLKPPRPPLTSFGAFSKGAYSLDKGKQLNIAEVSKKLSHQWSRLPMEIKQVYKIKAENDRKRFALELKQYLERKLQGVSDFPLSLESLILSSFNCLDDNECMHCTVCQLSFFNTSCKQSHFCGRPHLLELIKKLEAVVKRHNKNGVLSNCLTVKVPKVTNPITVTPTSVGRIVQEKRICVASLDSHRSVQKDESSRVNGGADEKNQSDNEDVRLMLRRKLLESQSK